MHFRGFLPVRLPSRRIALGLSLIGLTSMLGSSGCMDYSLTGLYIVPPTGHACTIPGTSVQFNAYGVYTKGGHASETKDLTDQVTWTTNIANIANMSKTGLLTPTGIDLGIDGITATAPGEFKLVIAFSDITVLDDCSKFAGGAAIRKLSTIRLIPGDQNMTPGDTSEVLAIGQFSAAPYSNDLTHQVSWTSSDPQVAKVNAEGLVTAVSAGDAVLTVTGTDSRGLPVTSTEKIHVGSSSLVE